MGNQSSKDPEILSRHLKQELDKEGFESIADFEYTLQRTRKDLEDLECKGRKNSTRGQQLTTLLKRLEEILKIHQQVLQQSSALEAVLLGALKKEGFDHDEDFEKELERTCSDLTRLKAENKQGTSEGKELHGRLHRLESIAEMRGKIGKIRDDGMDTRRSSVMRGRSLSRRSSAMRRPSLSPSVGAAEIPISNGSFGEAELSRCLEHFTDVLQNIPDCTEKFLALLVSHFQVLSHPYHTQSHVQFTAPEVRELLVALEQWIRDEGLEDSVVLEAMGHIKELSEPGPGAPDDVVEMEVEAEGGAVCDAGAEAVDIPRQERNEQLWHALLDLQKHIQPLDLGQILTLVTKAEQAVQLLSNREVVLILGAAGVGKTTTLQYLSGAAMKRTVCAVNGEDHIYAADGPGGCAVGAVTAVQCSRAVSIEDLSEDLEDEGVCVTLCDTPGFGAGEGPEGCIANAHTIVMAARVCRSVRPLVLLSWPGMGEQGEGLAKASGILGRLFRSVPAQLAACTYAFTKTPPHREGYIHPVLQHRLQTLSRAERKRLDYVALLQDMVRKTGCPPLVINPMDPLARHDVLERVLEAEPIAQPHAAFRTYVADADLQLLENQLRKSVDGVRHALRRGDMGLLRYRVDQLWALADRMPVHCLQKARQSCTRHIRSHADALVDDVRARLSMCLEDGDHVRDRDVEACRSRMASLVQLASTELHDPEYLEECADRCKAKVHATQHALLTSVRALHDRVADHLEPFSQAPGDDALPAPSSPVRRSSSPLQPPSPAGADGAEGVAWMCSSLQRAGQQLHEMQQIVQQLGPVVGQPMHEGLEAMHDQGMDGLLGVHATLREAAFALLRKARVTRALGVISVLKVTVRSAEAQGFAQHLAAVFEDDMDRFRGIFADGIDEAVEVLSASVDVARGGGPREAAEDERVRRVLTVAQGAHEGLRHAALPPQLGAGFAQAQERRLQSAFATFFAGALAAVRALLSAGGARAAPIAQVLWLLDRTWAFSHAPLAGPGGHAAVQDMTRELQETLSHWTQGALQHLHKLRYAPGLPDADYDDLCRAVRDLTQCTAALSASQWGLCGRELERVHAEMASVLAAKREAVAERPLGPADPGAVREAAQAQRMARRLRGAAPDVPGVAGAAAALDALVTQRLEEALTGAALDVVPVLEQWTEDGARALDALANAFLFVGACEAVPAVAELCERALLGLRGAVQRWAQAKDRAAEGLLSGMRALLESVFEGPQGPEDGSLEETLTQINAEQITCTVDWMRFQAAFGARACPAVPPPESESLRAYAALGAAARVDFARSVAALEALHAALREAVERGTAHQLQRAVLCACHWRRFDGFLAEPCRFEALCNVMERGILQRNTSLLADMRLDLHLGRYPEFREKYARLDNAQCDVQHGLAPLVQELAAGVRKLAGDVKGSLAALDLRCCTATHLREVVQKVGQLRAAEGHVLELLPPEARAEVTPQAMTAGLWEAMAAALDALDVRDTGDFRGTESSLTNYEEKVECLAPLAGGADAGMGPLVQRLTDHRHALQRWVEEACARYDPPPPADDAAGDAAAAVARWCVYFEGWARSPPKELYDALDSACGTASALFPRAKARLQSGLCAALDGAFAALEGPADFQRGAVLCDAVEDALRYCPMPLVQRFQPRLKAVKEGVTRRRETVLREIKAKADAGQLIALVDQFVDCGARGEFGPMEAVRNEIRRLIGAQAAQVAGAVARGDVARALRALPAAWAQWQSYLEALRRPFGDLGPWRWLVEDPECAGRCAEVRRVVGEAVAQALRRLTEQQQHDPSAFFAQLDADFALLVAILKTGTQGEGHAALQDCGVDPVPTACGIVDAVLHIIARLHAEFQEHVHEGVDFAGVKPVLKMAQQLQPARGRLDAYAGSDVGQALHPAMKGALGGWQGYPAMVEGVRQATVRLQAELLQPVMPKADALGRTEFYRQLGRTYERMRCAAQLGDHLSGCGVDPAALCKEVDAHLRGELRRATQLLLERARQIPGADDLYAELHLGIENLSAFREHFGEPRLAQEAAGCAESVTGQILSQARQTCAEAWRARCDRGAFIEHLVEVKRLAVGVAVCRQAVHQMIDTLLRDLKALTPVGGAKEIAVLAVHLNEVRRAEHRAAAQMLVADHDAFVGYALALRNERTLKFGVADVLQGLRGDGLDSAALRDAHAAFDAEYWGLVQDGLRSPGAADRIVREAREAAAHAPTAATVRRLVAQVFAFWTLSHTQYYAEARGAADGAAAGAHLTNYLLQPHSAQVLSVFRLLNVDGSSDAPLAHHLVQIGTGEGKSVTLAVTAAVLALLGHRVDCACYSEYLSARDHAAFQGLFRAFGLAPRIKYGTFNTLCEDFINRHGDVRSCVLDHIASPAPPSARGPPDGAGAKGRVLLIDEVDVFFQADFYGNAYKPLALLQDPAVHALVGYVWEHRAARPAFSAVRHSAAYRAVCQRFGGWEDLVEGCVRGMLADLRSFESAEYVVRDGRIGYEREDGVSFTATYGYKTMFAHFKEHEARRVSRGARDARVGLLIACGNFSYAEVPRAYACIMGVTGTLETLSACERALLADVYRIRRATYVPSVYGRNQLQFAPESPQYVVIESARAHFGALRSEINRRLVGTHHLQRAVLVFFGSKQQLREFYHCDAMADLRDAVRTMTEETSAAEKDNLVRQAVTPGSVTLLTREFGRGTDFKCFDDRLISAGGVHVIQTFVSDSLSEETQIKGRTARQGDIGSYSMVLTEEELERFSITSETVLQMRASGRYYSTIHRHRQDLFEKLYPESIRYVSEIQADHIKSVQFVDSLLAGDLPAARAFLVGTNRRFEPAEGAAVSRTLVLMDATYSMKDLLLKTKTAIKTMFDRAYWVLRHEKKESAFELQLAVYRNYNVPEHRLLQHSAWEGTPENLHAFISGVAATGGWGNEAVEVALWHANEEHARQGLHQVILIGDMPPNTPSEVPAKRASLGEAYWQTTRFHTATTARQQLERLHEHGIPVHAFYIDSPDCQVSAKPVFELIARESGGQCMPLDIASDAGAQMLTDLVTERILDDLGGDQLVSAYRSEFCSRQVGHLKA